MPQTRRHLIQALSVALALTFAPPAASRAAGVVDLPDSSSGVVLNSAYPGQSSFLLSLGGIITNTGNAVQGNASQNWYLENHGTIDSTGTTGNSGVLLNSLDQNTSRVDNYGSITSSGTTGSSASGIRFQKGGLVYNYAGGFISGFDGVHTDGGSILVDNSGTIQATTSGIYSGQGALIYNRVGAVISGGTYCILSNGSLNFHIYNSGTISSPSKAVGLENGGLYSLYNTSDGVITGGNRAVFFDGAGGQILNEGLLQSTNVNDIVVESHGDGNVYINAGQIQGNSGNIGFSLTGNNNTFYNLGEISGTTNSIVISGSGNQLVLGQMAYLPAFDVVVTGLGPSMSGAVSSTGDNDIVLTDNGSSAVAFSGFSDLTMRGNFWTLSGDFSLTGAGLGSLAVDAGSLLLTGAVDTAGGAAVRAGGSLFVGDAAGPGAVLVAPGGVSVAPGGTLGGWGTVQADVLNLGMIVAGGIPLQGPAQLRIQGDLNNEGLIDLQRGEPGNTLLIAGNMRGAVSGAGLPLGRLLLNARLGGDGSPVDALIVDGGAITGRTAIQVDNKGGQGGFTQNGIPVVLLQNGAVSAPDSFNLARPAAAGVYSYFLARNPADQQWYLFSRRRSEPGAYLSNIYSAFQMFRHSLYDRQGEGGARREGRWWMYAKGTDWSGRTGAGDIEMRGQTGQARLGVDLLNVSAGASDALHAGPMGGYGQARSEAHLRGEDWNSDGRVEAWSLGLYASWFQHDASRLGLYADSWVQYGRQNNTVSGRDMVDLSYDSALFAASLEVGWAFEVLEEKRLVLTPQAQVVWNDYDAGGMYEEFSDTHIRGADTSGPSTRLSLRAGGDIPLSGGAVLRPFAEAGWLHMPVEMRISVNDTEFTLDHPENLAEFKVGLQCEFTGGLAFWAQADTRRSGGNYRDAGLGLGLRYDW